MAKTEVNNLKTRSAQIIKVVAEGRYDTEDISQMEREFVLKHAPKPRVLRTDLQPGNIVVMLEGPYTGKRAVFVKQLGSGMAVVSGVRDVNGVPPVRIDERFLFKLSATVSIPSININGDDLTEVKRGRSQAIESEPTSAEREVEGAVSQAVRATKFMRAYLADPFKVDHSVEFYSQEY